MTRGLAIVTLLMLAAGCAPGLGTFCHRDSDCKPGLRCSALGDERGVCTYPEGIPQPDQRTELDQAPPDSRIDAADDGRPPDLPLDLEPDLPPPDLPEPDQGPDSAQPDAAAPD